MYCTVPVYTIVLQLLNYANTSFVQIQAVRTLVRCARGEML